ncbi:MAG: hypothetical protein KTR13_01335 [Saprospiraceae bacterium]|nr:hypothetical protein [Saprospiraceae bacterium]
MQVVEINSPELRKAFLELPVSLYKSDPNYIRPWDHDVENVFNPEKNKWFREGEVTRWLLKDGAGKFIGRIAAFTHPKIERNTKTPTGGCGFFECINDQSAANLLFNTAKAWLKTKGKESMDGPINFGEQDKWWGLLVQGFEPAQYGMNYNPPYYQELFENYGFGNYYNQNVFRYDLSKHAPEKFHKAYQKLIKDPDISFDHARKNNLAKYAEDFRQVYNEAWGKAHAGFKPMRKEQTAAIMKTLKPIMIEDTLIFAYHKERPIGIFLSIPNLNEIIKPLNGKFGLFQKLQFLWRLKITKSFRTLSAIIFGIVPDFQGKGVDAGLAVMGQKWMIEPGKYDFIELMWIGDFNPKMNNIAEQLDTKKSKVLTTYRYHFDGRPVERHPIINVKKKSEDA